MTTKKRPRARSHASRNQVRATRVAPATGVDAAIARKFKPAATPPHPGLRKGVRPWYAGIGRGYDRARWRCREQINKAGADLAAFLEKSAGYVPPYYVAHITKVQRSTLTRAAQSGRIRSITHTFPSGARIVLVNLSDALRLG